MATTNNLQSTITWCQPFLKNQPLSISQGEPAITIANIILQTILGPPLVWRWNRGSATFTCATVATPPPAPTVDYSVSVNDFGFIENAWLQDATGASLSQSYELEVKKSLALDTTKARPKYVCDFGDDNAGNITFRVAPAPDANYPAFVTYQKKPVLMTSLASLWAPIPDEYAYLYNWGFLALACMVISDPRFPIFNQKFMSHLLGAQEGLDEMQKNIFLGNWLDVVKALERAQQKTQQGIGARGQ
ncbi:MAG TPA: hypothetical protein VMT22_03080 [Terriglobales bacterium]|nr:hypothetical protein [Terriglobales bacterium]